MEKYVPASQTEKEMTIVNFPADIEHIPITFSEDNSSLDILEMVSDMKLNFISIIKMNFTNN